MRHSWCLMVTSGITKRTKAPQHCAVAKCGTRFSPLQLSSGVLMTPLMAAWAAAFCFFRSSIVFLNSFSSESLNKKPPPPVTQWKTQMTSNSSKAATSQSQHWCTSQKMKMKFGIAGEGPLHQAADQPGHPDTKQGTCSLTHKLWSLHTPSNPQRCLSCKDSSCCFSWVYTCVDPLGRHLLQNYAVLKTHLQSNNSQEYPDQLPPPSAEGKPFHAIFGWLFTLTPQRKLRQNGACIFILPPQVQNLETSPDIPQHFSSLPFVLLSLSGSAVWWSCFPGSAQTLPPSEPES